MKVTVELDNAVKSMLEDVARANNMTLEETVKQACNALANNSTDDGVLQSIFYLNKRR
ncbi:hypothetical protein GCM10027040_36290 [Halomonas shantousis]